MRENKGVLACEFVCILHDRSISIISLQEKILFNFHIITLLLTTLVWLGWLNIDLTVFFSLLWMGKTKEAQGGAIVAIL